MTRTTRLLIYSLVLLTLTAPATLSAVSRSSLIFLLIEPSSRAGGMAEAHVAQVDDAFAGFWNPGAMAFNRKTQVAGMHTNWFGAVEGIDDMYYEYLAWNQHFEDIGNLGMHIIYLTYGKQERTDGQGNSLGTFSSYEVAVAMSYAAQLRENIGGGVNFKFVLSDLAPSGTGATESNTKGRALSWGIDLATQIRGFDFIGISPEVDAILSRLDFGANLQNLGPDVTYINDSQADPTPMNFRMGLSYRLLGRYEEGVKDLNRFTVNFDMNKELDDRKNDPFTRIFTSWFDDDAKYEMQSVILSVGGEYVYYDLIALRAGYIYDEIGEIKGPSFGIGLRYSFPGGYDLSADFAMQQAGELTDYNQTFSMGLEF